MSDRTRFSLLLAISVATTALATPAAQPADPAIAMPANAAPAALDPGQGGPDPACVANLAEARDRSIAVADAMLRERKFYSSFDSNCSEFGGRQCTAVRASCRSACAPKLDSACLAACDAPFQTCCHASKVAFERWWFDEKVKQCPQVRVPVVTPPPQPPADSDPGKGTTVNKKAEWALMLRNANTMLEALGPTVDALALEQFNDIRRAVALMQVRASMASHGAKYAVVSGGAGRLWILTASGGQFPLDSTLGGVVRGRSTSRNWGEEDEKAHAELSRLTGLSALDVMALVSDVRRADERKELPPGATLEFPGSTGWPRGALASVEHASIKGTINGGGDFI